jgi:hypothetical protein
MRDRAKESHPKPKLVIRDREIKGRNSKEASVFGVVCAIQAVAEHHHPAQGSRYTGSSPRAAASTRLQTRASSPDGHHRHERGAEGAVGAGRLVQRAHGRSALDEVHESLGVERAQPPHCAPVQRGQPPQPQPPERAEEPPPFSAEPRHRHLPLPAASRRRYCRRSGRRPPWQTEQHGLPRDAAWCGRLLQVPHLSSADRILSCFGALLWQGSYQAYICPQRMCVKPVICMCSLWGTVTFAVLFIALEEDGYLMGYIW